MNERTQILEQVERLTASEALHHSEALCKLLRYLAQHSLDEPGGLLKEYRIATEVFGRPAEYDPQVDSTVRVQAGRLRAKLAKYYSTEGAEDPVVLDLPKGSYSLTFQIRPSKQSRDESTAGDHDSEEARSPRLIGLTSSILALLLLVALATIGWLLTHENGSVLQPAPAPVQAFWGGFVGHSTEPWVIFSNAAFVGRPETGIRYYNPRTDQGASIWDHYTGVGEVLSVHNLDVVFASLHGRVRVKRGSLFTLDDARQNDLIFLGSPSENLTLREIPNTSTFVFQRNDGGQPRSGDLAIMNLKPGPDEPTRVLSTPNSEQLTEDYAIIGLERGPSSNKVLILAGITTFGTQAAVEYVCTPNSLEELLSRLGVKRAEDMSPFEALIHVKVAHGVPVETRLVALHKLP